tara:strand:- start:545 stop:1435 length:891 start_codon:yes stop_codon:yes gene_type:complete
MEWGKSLLARDVYNTRKLGKDKVKFLERLGTHGDTEIGVIDGELAHLNVEEKDKLSAADVLGIDQRRRAEDQIKEEANGGERNLLSGLMGFHPPSVDGGEHDDTPHTHLDIEGKNDEGVAITIPDYTTPQYSTEQVLANQELLNQGYAAQAGAQGVGEQSYETLRGMSEQERAGHLYKEFGLGQEYLPYISPFLDKPFQLLEQESAFSQKQLGFDISEGVGGAVTGAAVEAGQRGFESSGDIQANLDKQMKTLMRDYSTGQEEIAGGLKRDVYAEQRRQQQQFYTDVGGARAAKGS